MCRIRGSQALSLAVFWWTVTEGMTQLDVLTNAKPQRCRYERAYEMYGAYCVGLGLDEIPSLKRGIEILDFSNNGLKKLKADTFTSYTSLKYLYLANNQIYSIDKDAFSPLGYLQILDLSKNVILDLPDAIFQLPSLRKLYLQDNLLHISLPKLRLQKPIQAPLEVLDISKSEIPELPNWGTLPYLTHYNISYNPLTRLEPSHFASMCKLESVDLTKAIDNIKEMCTLKPTLTWLQEKRVYFKLDDYSKLNTREFGDCPAAEEKLLELNSTYHRCKAAYIQFQSHKTSRRTWLTVTGGLAGFLIGFMLLLYLMHRHNVAQTKTKAEKMKATPTNDPDRQDTVPILVNDTNNVSRL